MLMNSAKKYLCVGLLINKLKNAHMKQLFKLLSNQSFQIEFLFL